jgi:hypothetical protein
VATAISALDPAALSDRLRGSALTGGAEILEVASRRVGDGQVASCWELELTIDGRAERPKVVAKVPSDDPLSRATAAAQHLYEREVGFYRELAHRVEIRTPACHCCDFDDDGGFVLVLETMCPAASPDQLEGISVARARLALYELAGLHAPCWDAGTMSPAFLAQVGESLRGAYAEIVPALMASFLERYGEALTDVARDAISWLIPRLGTYFADAPGPRTVVHGDFRADNLLFDGRCGEVPLAVVDWQTIGTGAPALDVAYLLTTSLPTDVRRAEERALVAGYHRRLGDLGVVGYPADDLWDSYVRHCFQGLVLLACAAMIVARTQRGDEMFLTMIERCATAVDDLGARLALEG